MEIEKSNKIKNLFKRYGLLTFACVLTFAVAISIIVAVPNNEKENEPVGAEPISFGLPMTNAVIAKDYADDRLQLNESLNRWEIHLALDLCSENDSVFSVADGVVKSISSNSLEGCVIEIEHVDGFVSVYSSLSEDVKVSEGQSVSKGQQIGVAAATATNESLDGSHLHFVLLKNGVEVDPNNYLDLQNK